MPSNLPSAPASVPFRRRSFLNFRFLGFVGLFLLVLVPGGWHYGPLHFFFSCLTLLEVVLLFNILIVVHELGHFFAARWRGLKVEKFAIWFGKPLWSKKIDGIEYILGSIPAGGYVALPQMAPMEIVEGKSETPAEKLPPAAPWDKIIVAFAGPLFSFGLAFVFGLLVWVAGKPVGDMEATTTIGFVVPGSPADQAHLLPGDKIRSIDGHPVYRFIGAGDTVIWRIITSTAPTIPVEVDRAGQQLVLNVAPHQEPHSFYQRAQPRKIGIGPARSALIVKAAVPFSPAALAGIVPGDQVTQLNGQKIYSEATLDELLKDRPHDPIHLQILHQGQTRELTLQPVRPISGVSRDDPSTDVGLDEWENKIAIVHPTPLAQVEESVENVIDTLSALFAPHTTVGASQLTGPIGIMNLFYLMLSTDHGWQMALWLGCVINVNLAIMNLLPFPILDGGHILFSLIEWVRRRPLSMKLIEPMVTACAMMLIGFILYITFFDAQDSIKMSTNGAGGEIKFAPPEVK